jgi:2-methylcitrate dehydratase PrpD
MEEHRKMSTLLEQLTDFSANVRFEDLPEAVVSESKRMLLDSIGCALGALGTEKGRIAIKVARDMGGPAQARIIGTDAVLSTSAAAFANGELITTLDYDALISPPGHVAPYVIPAMLAVAELNGSDGKELIRAVALAHELGARFGSAMADVRDVPKGQKISFPAITGYSSSIFGGTLGTAILAGLTRDQTISAMGLAGHIAPSQSMGKWVRTMPATTDKYVMAGWFNQAQILAVNLAREGYVGDASVLEGDYGFWRFMGSNRWKPEALTDRLGTWWRFPQAAIYKPYAHCRISQTALDCLANLMQVHDLTPDEIERIDTYTDPHGALAPMWSSKDIVSILDAQMSIPFAVSLVVHKVENGPIWQDEETIRNPKYLAFQDKVTVQAHPDFEDTIREEPGSRIGKVVVHARGTTFTEERKYRKGSPASPETRMSDAELADKFRVNAERYLPEAQISELADMLLNLEKVDSTSQFTRLWQPPRGPKGVAA